jgi:hypothetical protein
MSLDAAAETHNRADFTAITTWGVFLNEEADAYHIIVFALIEIINDIILHGRSRVERDI